jgi:hypothetical protein
MSNEKLQEGVQFKRKGRAERSGVSKGQSNLQPLFSEVLRSPGRKKHAGAGSFSRDRAKTLEHCHSWAQPRAIHSPTSTFQTVTCGL